MVCYHLQKSLTIVFVSVSSSLISEDFFFLFMVSYFCTFALRLRNTEIGRRGNMILKVKKKSFSVIVASLIRTNVMYFPFESAFRGYISDFLCVYSLVL